ncbi:DUF3515 domain-containing protein [Gordonia iterans]
MTEEDSKADREQEEDGSDAAAPGSAPASDQPVRLSPALIATLVTIPIVVITAFVVYAVIKSNEIPQTPIQSYPTSNLTAETQACGPLIEKLPDSFGEYRDKTVDGHLVRWTDPDSATNEPLELRCGVARPEGLAPTSSLQVVHPVQWFITDTDENRGQAYVLVDRRPYIAVWVPAGAGNAALTDISGIVAELEPAPLDFG